MKVKTSVTLSEELLEALEGIEEEYKNRSAVIEEALREFVERRGRQIREEKDLQILNQRAEALNKESKDVLSYQVDL